MIRGKGFGSIGISQSDRKCCNKSRKFLTDEQLRNASNKQLVKEIKRHKLGRKPKTKAEMIAKLGDHYALYHTQ